MATTNYRTLPAAVVNASLVASDLRYHFVKKTATATGQTGGYEVALCAATADVPLGVLVDRPTVAGQSATVAVEGIIKVMAGATIAPGQPLATAATGRAQPAVAGQIVRGFAMTGGAAGDLIEMYSSGFHVAP